MLFHENNCATLKSTTQAGNFVGIIGGQDNWITNDYPTKRGESSNSVLGFMVVLVKEFETRLKVTTAHRLAEL